MGFTFDDTDKSGTASSIAEMHRLIESDPRNAERIFPYLGGDEVNNSPTHAHHRYVINFEDIPLRREEAGRSWFHLDENTQQIQLRLGVVCFDYPGPVAADWPELLGIVEQRVKPERDKDNREVRKREWWKYAERAPALASALERSDRNRAFCISRVSQHFAFAWVADKIVAAETLVMFVMEKNQSFATIQSRVHEVWARIMAATLEDRFRYTPSDCFETFPFPHEAELNDALGEAGRSYAQFRASLMIQNDEGLTKTYNRFHNPNERSREIVELRRLHDVIDNAVIQAYGWHDLRPAADFFPEFEAEDNDDTDPPTGRSRQKQPRYRYRWPDLINDEVLARLLELNTERSTLQDSTDDTQTPRSSKTPSRKRG